MDLYDQVAMSSSAELTKRYSTSFSSATRLFPSEVRTHIYNIYGLVRLADEIVDTYAGKDQLQLLNDLETETYAAIRRGYAPNLTLQAFAITARKFHIEKAVITAFFTSMRMDIAPPVFTEALYKKYIYGSAEVVGLMCLSVFCDGDQTQYQKLKPGAQALGAAFQKVNFLRDFKDDYQRLHRVYFPGVSFDTFSDKQKQKIVADIRRDFKKAQRAAQDLPSQVRPPVIVAYVYYSKLLNKLDRATAEEIKAQRIRIPNRYKFWLLIKVFISSKVIH